jgi:Transposase IS200 like
MAARLGGEPTSYERGWRTLCEFSKGAGFAPIMKNKLQRHDGRKELHFITFSCYQRRPLLNGVRAKTVFVKILGEVRTRYQFSLVGYVLMPEHVHLLIGEAV